MKSKGKKPKLGKGAPSVSSSEFSKLSKLTQKELGDNQASGTPDQWDEENIQQALGRFETDHPGLIQRVYNDTLVEVTLSGMTKNGEVMGGWRKGFWIPQLPRGRRGFDYGRWLERAYPSFWRNEKHMRWYMRKFPQFSFEYMAKKVKR